MLARMYTIDLTKPCILATTLNSNGYGGHRKAWETKYGPVPDGLVLDHVCKARACLEPDHLEPVTAKVNVERTGQTYATRTECKRGHDMTDPANRLARTTRGYRTTVCRRCQYDSTNASNRRRREAARNERSART